MTTKLIEHAKNPKAVFVFAHGAGADMNSAFMDTMSKLLLDKGISVVRFNFPYMDKRVEDGKRRPPDRMPTLLQTLNEHLNDVDTELPVYIGGKSMGSRVCATWLAEHDVSKRIDVRGLVAFGYPFHPIGKLEKLRLTPLQDSDVPTMIVQGDRDKLGNRDEIATYDLPSSCQVIFMEDGDHDLKPRVKSGFTHQQHIESASLLVEGFIDKNEN